MGDPVSNSALHPSRPCSYGCQQVELLGQDELATSARHDLLYDGRSHLIHLQNRILELGHRDQRLNEWCADPTGIHNPTLVSSA